MAKSRAILSTSLLLGGYVDASTVPDDDRGADLKDALAYLELALEILDSNKVSPAIGARLQEVVDLLNTPDDG